MLGCCERSRYAFLNQHLPNEEDPNGRNFQSAPPELADEPEDGTDTGTEEMCRLETNYGSERIFVTVTRIGVNSHNIVGCVTPYVLAHVAECVGHVIIKDVDTCFRCGM